MAQEYYNLRKSNESVPETYILGVQDADKKRAEMQSTNQEHAQSKNYLR